MSAAVQIPTAIPEMIERQNVQASAAKGGGEKKDDCLILNWKCCKVPELERLLGKAYGNFAAVLDYLDCYYNTEIKYGRRGKYGLYAMMHRQAGRSLCTLYVNEGYFTLLIVLAQKEQQVYEAAETAFMPQIQTAYSDAHPYPDGRWLFINFCDEDCMADIRRLLAIKRAPDEQALTMCGCKCSLCAAYVKNIKKDDRRQQLSALWKKAFDIDIPPDTIACPGCRSVQKDAVFDTGCPVRSCVHQKGLVHCGECGDFPCQTFGTRDTARFIKDKEQSGVVFDDAERALLAAYSNRARICAYRRLAHTSLP